MDENVKIIFWKKKIEKRLVGKKMAMIQLKKCVIARWGRRWEGLAKKKVELWKKKLNGVRIRLKKKIHMIEIRKKGLLNRIRKKNEVNLIGRKKLSASSEEKKWQNIYRGESF